MSYEIVKLRILILNREQLGRSHVSEINKIMTHVRGVSASNSGYKIEHVYVSAATTQRLGIMTPESVTKAKASVGYVVQCVFKNPNSLKRIYAPLLSCNIYNFYSKLGAGFTIPDLFNIVRSVPSSTISRLGPSWVNNSWVDLVIRTGNVF